MENMEFLAFLVLMVFLNFVLARRNVREKADFFDKRVTEIPLKCPQDNFDEGSSTTWGGHFPLFKYATRL